MTLLEKKSQRKAKAIRTLVDNGEYSPAFALNEAERLNDEGKLLDVDYEPLAEYLEALMEEPIKEVEEEISTENTAESAENIENPVENTAEESEVE